ncbi:MAG: hypothetical protein CMN73_02840 [Sphingomonas sp.]|nr:hypothetical protein [Sphingomonas sp.]|tara:strand:- start:921 stop:1646 length:726 start_codon:yes stop_codon:yes gene_type:complete
MVPRAQSMARTGDPMGDEMKRLNWGAATLIAALLLGCPGIAAAQAGQDTARFSVGALHFEMRMPDGYCLPRGAAADAAALAEAADPQNITLLALYPCASESAGDTDYYMIKIPRNLVTTPVPLEEMLPAMRALFQDPEFSASLNSSAGNAAGSVSDVAGTDVSIRSALKSSGVDDRCAYISGTIRTIGGGADYTLSVAACMTVAGSRVMTIYRYSDPGRDPDTLKPVVREAAEAIRLVETQ